MELTQQVREYARTKGVEEDTAVGIGLEEKALEFRKKGQIYVEQ
jgi:hypothetical protein